MNIGFVGLGNMGLPMAKNLLKAGFKVSGLNRSKGAEVNFSQAGGEFGHSLSEMAQELDIIITCLPMPSDVRDVYLNESGLLNNGKEDLILIDCSTVNPELNQEIFKKATSKKIDFLDAPISGGNSGAEAGTLSIMVGGNYHIFCKIKPVLEAMGSQISYVGESGSGSAVKLINQLMVGIHTQAVSEALNLAKRVGLDIDQLVDILSASLAQSRVLDRHFKEFISKEDFTPGFAIKLLNKDLNLVTEFAEENQIELPIGSRIRAMLNKATISQLGDEDMSAMLKYNSLEDEGDKNSMKSFAVFLPMKDEEKSQRFRSQHLQFLEDRRNEGIIFANGRFTDGAGGLVIYLSHSLEEAEEWVKKDPYIIEGARDYEIHEWEMIQA